MQTKTTATNYSRRQPCFGRSPITVILYALLDSCEHAEGTYPLETIRMATVARQLVLLQMNDGVRLYKYRIGRYTPNVTLETCPVNSEIVFPSSFLGITRQVLRKCFGFSDTNGSEIACAGRTLRRTLAMNDKRGGGSPYSLVQNLKG